MYTKPLLILAFNRPNHVKRLIDSLRPYKPQKILIGIDGPRKNNQQDRKKISRVLIELKKIDWTTDVDYRIRETNLGLRFAVADAVTWAIEKYGEVIVVEDDIEVGPEFLSFMTDMLDAFRDDGSIGHISGYNLVPTNLLKNPNDKFRYSIVPESYAWATWSRAWELFDPSLSWSKSVSTRALKVKTGTFWAAASWKINFLDARKERINTWAYRWVATLWANDLRCISPNRNLIKYTGQDEGTHTFLPTRHKELSIDSLAALSTPETGTSSLAKEDEWILKTIFHGSIAGVVFRILTSLALSLSKRIKS